MKFKSVEEVTYEIPGMNPVDGDFNLDAGRKGTIPISIPERLVNVLKKNHFSLSLERHPQVSSSFQPYICYGGRKVGRIDGQAVLHILRNRPGSEELENLAKEYE
jgi:hypothetical protein